MATTGTATASLLDALRTATNLSLTDLADLNSLATSSPRLGASQDEVLARQLWRGELQHFSRTLSDGVLARDLQQALRDNRPLEAVRREREVREVAAAKNTTVNRAGSTTQDALSAGRSAATMKKTTDRTTSLSSTRDIKQGAPALSSSRTPSGPMCYICLSPPDVVRRLPCAHVYCSSCVLRLFLLATSDESHHPASCCKQTINLEYAFGALSFKQIKAYKDAKEEFAMPNRVYCSKKHCSTFLGPVELSARLKKCSKCFTVTCTACKGPGHPSTQACAADADDEAAAKLVKQLRGRSARSAGG